MFNVVEHFEFRQRRFAQSTHEGVDRAVALADKRHRLAVDAQAGFAFNRAVALNGFEMLQRDWDATIQVLALKGFVNLSGSELATSRVSEVVDDFPNFLMHELRQLIAEFLLENVCNAAFTRL